MSSIIQLQNSIFWLLIVGSGIFGAFLTFLANILFTKWSKLQTGRKVAYTYLTGSSYIYALELEVTEIVKTITPNITDIQDEKQDDFDISHAICVLISEGYKKAYSEDPDQINTLYAISRSTIEVLLHNIGCKYSDSFLLSLPNDALSAYQLLNQHLNMAFNLLAKVGNFHQIISPELIYGLWFELKRICYYNQLFYFRLIKFYKLKTKDVNEILRTRKLEIHYSYLHSMVNHEKILKAKQDFQKHYNNDN